MRGKESFEQEEKMGETFFQTLFNRSRESKN
jgi:hypothetical protein